MSDKDYVNRGSIYTRTIEECSELIQILCKARRFGWYNYHPKDRKRTTNAELTLREIQDLRDCLDKLEPKVRIIQETTK